MGKEIENINGNPLNTEERILEAATEIFALQGYDATSVDEIAKRANVSKPLIYYYFKSKKNILEELIKRYIKSYFPEKEEYIQGITNINREDLYERLQERMDFFSKNDKALKVIAMELLKDNPEGESILSMINPLFDTAIPKIEEMGVDIENRMDLFVSTFFFGTAPILMLMLYGDKFCQFYQIEREELNKRFFNVMKSMYIDFFVDKFESQKK
ncbi:MAG: TetR/AcrR family transcriptional regulator [Methanobacterium sp.]|nr:TetR/AcrR family transcriptional regulator [Methanobacterium sp.]